MNIGNNYELESEGPGWDQSSGDFTEYVYKGTRQAIFDVFLDFRFRDDVLSLRIDQKGEVHHLYVRKALNAGVPFTTLEIRMPVTRVHKSIFEPGLDLGVSDDELRTIRNAINDPVKGQSPALTNPNAINLYVLALKGVEHRYVYQHTLQVIRTASPGFNWAAFGDPNTSVGEILSTAEVRADARIAAVNWVLPDGISADAGFIFGWLKHPPEYELSVGNRSTERRDYEFGLWSTFLYPS